MRSTPPSPKRFQRIFNQFVIAGLDPAIHLFRKMDARVKPAHDEECASNRAEPAAAFGLRITRSCKVIAFAAFAVFASFFSNCRAADTALIEAARREGRVVWYTTLIVNQAIRPLKEAFESRFPGIELQYVRADEAPTAAKIMAESSAGHGAADIFDGISNMVPLKRAAIAAAYWPASAGAYPADLKDKDGYWHAILLYVFAPGINTALVPLEAAPKSYPDLLAPKWRAKMAWNPAPLRVRSALSEIF